ncbi:MAG: nucleotidyltransferase family protein [Gemmatimonadaceae bacterium]
MHGPSAARCVRECRSPSSERYPYDLLRSGRKSGTVNPAPSLDEIVKTLRSHEAILRQRGVARVAVFGSVARGGATASSDVDLLLDLDKVRFAYGVRAKCVHETVSFSAPVKFLYGRFDHLSRVPPPCRADILP